MKTLKERAGLSLLVVVFFTISTTTLTALTIPRIANAAEISHLTFNTEDVDFILDQIIIAERHAAGEDLLDILPNASVMWGLRTVDGSYNNLIPGQENFGKADEPFPVLDGMRVFPDAQENTIPQVGPLGPTTYASAENVIDSTPRIISHLIVNQSVENPAAVLAAADEGGDTIGPDITGTEQLFIPNSAPDEGLSAPVNAFMTFFGQFFDHGLDLINKGGNGTVFMPLDPSDPLFDPASPQTNFMAMTRATRGPGPDGVVGDDPLTPENESLDDTFLNATTPHVDQQQTYASHASSQILLRHYIVRDGVLLNSGRLLDGYGNDGVLDTADDGGLATWDTMKAQARLKLGIELDDLDGANIPMILSDLYGNFIPGPLRGLPQLVIGIEEDGSLTLLEGDTAAPVDASAAVRINHSYFLDVAHTAAPNDVGPDPDNTVNPRIDTLSGVTTRGIREPGPEGTYDDELLGLHFTCGDGRCNENIALTTIHSIFHHEHNRIVDITRRVILDSGDISRLNQWLDSPLSIFPAWAGLPHSITSASLAEQAATRIAIDALNLPWNGSRIFQAARFGTEMQYNRIVFDEFAPTLAGLKDVFEGFHTNIDPTITAEFSQSVYRFGHSMLTQTVDRYLSDFTTITYPDTADDSQLGLFEAFLNPMAFQNIDDSGIAGLSPEQASGAVVRGITRTVANEIDEFVTGALQNHLVGLPLDLGALNIARGRDVGNPPLNAARKRFYEATGDTRLMPYRHWVDYLDNMRHETTLVNFIAAYGTHPLVAGPDRIIGSNDAGEPATFADRRAAACAIMGALSPVPPGGPDGFFTDDPLTAIDESADNNLPDVAAYCEANGFGTPPAMPADALDFLYSRNAWTNDSADNSITGLDKVDFWNGGLAEERMPFGGYLGSTHNFVFETQIESLQNGDRFYYVGRTANINFFNELESNSFSSLVMRSTDIGEAGGGSLPLNIFAVNNHILEVDQSQQFDAAGDGTTADPGNESDVVPLVVRDEALLTTNIDVMDSTRVIQYTGGDHVTIGGTDGNDTIVAGIGDDSIIAGDGDDRIEGGDGADHIEGGSGDDIITDLSGPDVIEGGAGNDAINSGNEEDVIFGDEGNDFIVNPSELGEIFGGPGDDFIFDGHHNGHIRGGHDDDWMENLGGGEDLWQGDNGVAAELGESPIKGNDVFIAHGGNNDADMESGDDIVVDGPGIDRVEGQLGFDWVSFQNDRFGVDVDLDLTIFVRPSLPPSNNTILNRYDRVEGISGSPFSDILNGTNSRSGESRGNELVNFDLISGLDALVPVIERSDMGLDVVSGEPLGIGWDRGEIILAGAGSDIIVGESGDDIIDGDAALTVMISTPDPAIRMGAIGKALLEARKTASTATSQADLDLKAVASFSELQTTAIAAAIAARAAADAAQSAADAEDLALGGNSNLTITDSLGNLISNAVSGGALDGSLGEDWNAFMASCSAALRDLGWDVDTSSRQLANELIAMAEELEAQADLSLAEMQATADASAQTAIAAQASLVTAQINLDNAMALGADGIAGTADDGGVILVSGMRDIMDAVFGGYINPGELKISRVIEDQDPSNSSFDTAVYSGNFSDYTITDIDINGAVFVDPSTQTLDYTIVEDNRDANLGGDDRDIIRNIERLQFADQTLVLFGSNALPVGLPGISGSLGNISVTGNLLTASIAGVTDADNISPENPAGNVNQTSVSWTWQVEMDPGVFANIVRVQGNGEEIDQTGESITLSDEEAGLAVRVVGRFSDGAGVIETVISDPFPFVPAVAPSLTIETVEYRDRAGDVRLRIDGTMTPANATATLYAPGTVNTAGTACDGESTGATATPDELGEFRFNLRDSGLPANLITICIESNDGLAVEAST